MDIGIIKEQMRGLFPDILGIQFLEAIPEKITAEIFVRSDLCTLPGIMHGGAIMAFADTLGAVGTMLNMPQSATTTTIESKTNFLSYGKEGEKVIAECIPVHLGRQTMVWQTTLCRKDGKKVAIVTQTQLVMSPK